jgi:hypothetical protein
MLQKVGYIKFPVPPLSLYHNSSEFVQKFRHTIVLTDIHTYFIPEGAAGASQILLPDVHVLPKLLSYE